LHQRDEFAGAAALFEFAAVQADYDTEHQSLVGRKPGRENVRRPGYVRAFALR
jgi:hypothetical protein